MGGDPAVGQEDKNDQSAEVDPATRGTIWLAAAIIVLGSSALAGLILGIDRLVTWRAGGIAINSSIALCFLFAGIALVFTVRPYLQPWRQIPCLAIFVIVGTWLVQDFAGVGAVIDELFIPGSRSLDSSSLSFHMSAAAGIGLLLGAAAILALPLGISGVVGAQVLALAVGALGVLAALGHLYDVEALFSLPSEVGMSLPTAVGLILLAAALLVRSVGDGIMPWLLLDSPIAKPLRWLYLVVSVPLAAGLLGQQLVRYGAVDSGFSEALIVWASFFALAFALAVVGGVLERTDSERTESSTRYRLAFEIGRLGAWEWDLRRDRMVWDAALYRLYGLEPNAFETPDRFLALLHPDDRQQVESNFAKVQRGDRAGLDNEFRVVLPGGGVAWISSVGAFVSSARKVRTGRVPRTRAIGVNIDITARRQAEAALKMQQALQARELTHRMKNAMAVVQAVARQTLQTARSPAAFVPAFGRRLEALSRAFNLLTEGDWRGAELGDLVKILLIPLTEEVSAQVKIKGPVVVLSAGTCPSFALVLNELATNAAKYGALSRPNGSIEIAWRVGKNAEGERLLFTWRERGGPPVSPPESKGFGSTLIERGLQDARIERRFEPEGMECTIDMPLENEAALQH